MRLREEAHLAGDTKLHRKLRELDRASDLGEDHAGYSSTVDTLKAG